MIIEFGVDVNGQNPVDLMSHIDPFPELTFVHLWLRKQPAIKNLDLDRCDNQLYDTLDGIPKQD